MNINIKIIILAISIILQGTVLLSILKRLYLLEYNTNYLRKSINKLSEEIETNENTYKNTNAHNTKKEQSADINK